MPVAERPPPRVAGPSQTSLQPVLGGSAPSPSPSIPSAPPALPPCPAPARDPQLDISAPTCPQLACHRPLCWPGLGPCASSRVHGLSSPGEPLRHRRWTRALPKPLPHLSVPSLTPSPSCRLLSAAPAWRVHCAQGFGPAVLCVWSAPRPERGSVQTAPPPRGALCHWAPLAPVPLTPLPALLGRIFRACPSLKKAY